MSDTHKNQSEKMKNTELEKRKRQRKESANC